MSPSFLLGNPDLVEPVAPWCVVLDNPELVILMLTQPWLASEGLRRAELERQLAELSAELPLGPIYFQRIKRSVARLESIGAVRRLGSGRSCSFVLAPEGLAGLILNLSVLVRDPTIDGSELELKRALVVRWNLLLDRLAELPGDALVSEASNLFFDELEQLTVLGSRIMTGELIASALDVLQLINTQRERVRRMLSAAERQLADAPGRADQLAGIDLGRLMRRGHDRAAWTLAGSPEAMAVVSRLVRGTLPEMSLRAKILRYRHYLDYLDSLTAMYARQLRAVTIAGVRELLCRSKG